MAAHRTRWLPCLVMWPRWTLVSDSRWEGVSPAHEHRCRAVGKRVTSPISATKMAAMIGPTPLIAWIASYPRWPARRAASSALDHDQLAGVVIQQLQQRPDPQAVGTL